MKQRDLRWLVVLGCNLLFAWLVALANHYLAPVNVYLYAGGLLVTFASLRLDLRHGFTATLLTGLAVDAQAPVPFGTSMVLFGLAHAAIYYGRQRFPREEVVFALVVALLTNLFLFLALSFFLVGRNQHPGGAWLRLFADLLVSQLALALATPWFIALQARAFDLLQLHPESGRRLVS